MREICRIYSGGGDPEQSDTAVLHEILSGGQYRSFEVVPVSSDVNSPKNDGPSLIDPA